MFTLTVSDHVMIAHSFADPFFGPAQRLHGATYTVEFGVLVPALNDHAVVMDIGALRATLRVVLDRIDYRNLDEHPDFAGKLSTTEQVAQFIADEMNERLQHFAADSAPRRPAELICTLRESPVAWASYTRRLGDAA
ncbi:MAG TPA: 6-carboxytetrahydropterin synthase [Polyangiales bacterium]|nr:6-carboxytetrahydropterin synthase [Polyangiales bacterium]